MLIIFVIAGPGSIFFGATIPAAISQMKGSTLRVGSMIGIASLGNFAGYILTMLWWSDWLGDRGLAILICIGVVMVSWRGSLSFGVANLLRLGAVMLALLVMFVWPSTVLNVGYAEMCSPQELRAATENVTGVDHYRKHGHNVGVIHHHDGAESLVIEGYCSLMVTPRKGPSLPEFLVGVAPAFLVTNQSDALVLGVGTGITAGAALHVFKHVDAVEINPAIMELLPHYGNINDHISTHPRATLLLQDALTTLTSSGRKYNAIISTVTSPLYFSSGKLYTKDFFEIVKRRLAPGGVYGFWFDARVGPSGARVILNTLKSSFTHYGFVLLRSGYVLVVCSDSPLEFNPSVPIQNESEFQSVYKRIGVPLSLPELIGGLVFIRHKVAEQTWNAPINTFDRPVLEFEMSKLNLALSEKLWIVDLAGINLFETGFGQPGVLSDAAFQNRMLAMQDSIEQLSFPVFYKRYTTTNVPAAFFHDHGDFLVATDASGETVCAHATSLLASHQPLEAVRLATKYLNTHPDLPLVREREYLGWLRMASYRQLGQEVPATELEYYCLVLAKALCAQKGTQETLAQDIRMAVQGSPAAAKNNLELLLAQLGPQQSENLDFAIHALADTFALAASPERSLTSICPQTFRFPNRIFYRRILVELVPPDQVVQTQMRTYLARLGAGDYESRALLRLGNLLGLGAVDSFAHYESIYPL